MSKRINEKLRAEVEMLELSLTLFGFSQQILSGTAHERRYTYDALKLSVYVWRSGDSAEMILHQDNTRVITTYFKARPIIDEVQEILDESQA